jgi:hypothetical protein
MEDEEIKDYNDLIAVFCGGVLEHNPLLGEQYRFDEIGTPEFAMKIPPFGSLGRKHLAFHYDWRFLIFAIEECYNKINSKELEELFEKIKQELVFFELSGGTRIYMVYRFVVDFIQLYNNQNPTPNVPQQEP